MRRTSDLTALLAIIASVTALLCSQSIATPIAPGQTVYFDVGGNLQLPTGDVLATDSRMITLTYVNPDLEFWEPGDAQVTLPFFSKVVRDPGTQLLSFYYQIGDFDRPGRMWGAEGANVSYGSLGAFSTDCTIDADISSITRTPDGQVLDVFAGDEGNGSPPFLAVATDATNFNTGGSMTLQFSDEFLFHDPQSPQDAEISTAIANLTIPGTFQPVVAPEPSAALLTSAMLVICVSNRRRRAAPIFTNSP